MLIGSDRTITECFNELVKPYNGWRYLDDIPISQNLYQNYYYNWKGTYDVKGKTELYRQMEEDIKKLQNLESGNEAISRLKLHER